MRHYLVIILQARIRIHIMFSKKLFEIWHSEDLSNAILAISAMIFVVIFRKNVSKSFLQICCLAELQWPLMLHFLNWLII